MTTDDKLKKIEEILLKMVQGKMDVEGITPLQSLTLLKTIAEEIDMDFGNLSWVSPCPNY